MQFGQLVRYLFQALCTDGLGGCFATHFGPWETLLLRGLYPIGIATIFAPRIFRGLSTSKRSGYVELQNRLRQ